MLRKFHLTVPETLVARARDLAKRIMRGHPDRLRHLAAVAERAEALSVTVPATVVDTLVASSWFPDIGYAPAWRQTGFHPLDGATYLREEGWPDPVCALVAHHSGSRFVARIRGLHGPPNCTSPVWTPIRSRIGAKGARCNSNAAATASEARANPAAKLSLALLDRAHTVVVGDDLRHRLIQAGDRRSHLLKLGVP